MLSACEKVPLLAPSGSTITLTATATALPTSGTTDIIAQVLEAGGTPPHSGTQITFTTTLGVIEPAEARTDLNGRVIVKFLAGNAHGTATIVAISGGASTGANGAVKIAIGTAAVGSVRVSANPAIVPALGGTTTVTAVVLDINGNFLPSAPVVFTTTAGTLGASSATTDARGEARTTLGTSQQATVTASVGAQAPSTGGGTTGGGTTGGGTTGGGTTTSGQASGTVTVAVAGAPTILITPPSTAPSKGLPATFTIVVTAAAQNGSAVRDVTVNWGDGRTQSLGAFTGSLSVSHVYTNDGSFTVSATVVDASSNSTTVSTSVTVIPVPRPTVLVTVAPASGPVITNFSFTIQVTVPAGIGVVNTTIAFGDGEVRQLGGATSITVRKVYATTGNRTVTVTVVDTAGQSTDGTVDVSVTP